MGNLFKDLTNKRDPEFNVDDVKEKDLDKNKKEESEKGLTSREIAEKMFNNQTRDDLITSLL